MQTLIGTSLTNLRMPPALIESYARQRHLIELEKRRAEAADRAASASKPPPACVGAGEPSPSA